MARNSRAIFVFREIQTAPLPEKLADIVARRLDFHL
jgi:hypothetical protein